MRRAHLFTYRDILRIVREVEPQTAPGSAPTETMLILSCIFELCGDLIWSLETFPGIKIEPLFLGKVAARLMSVLVELFARTTARIQAEVMKILLFGQSEKDTVQILSLPEE